MRDNKGALALLLIITIKFFATQNIIGYEPRISYGGKCGSSGWWAPIIDERCVRAHLIVFRRHNASCLQLAVQHRYPSTTEYVIILTPRPK